MFTSVSFGLVAMFGWGILNCLVAQVSKKVETFKVAFLIQVFTFFPTLALLPILKEKLVLGKDFIFLSPLGVIGGISYLAMIKGFSEGGVSIVTPIMGTWAVVTSILSFIFLKEEVNSLKVLGILTTFLGILLVSADFKRLFKEKKIKLVKGAKWAGITALAWGVNFFLLAFFTRKLGWYQTNLGLRFWTALTFIGVVLGTNKQVSYFLRDVPRLVWGIIILDVFVFITYNIGLTYQESSIIATVSSASPLVSVLLGKILLKEKVSLFQKIGILSCLVGITSLSLA